MFLINGKHLPEGVGFRDANGNQYGSNWLNLSTEEEKLAIGITWVADPVRADDRFYWDGDINNPKALEDKLEEDDSTTKGLKSHFIAQVKDTAGKLLAQTDWYIIRKAERNVDVPADVVTKRANTIAESDRLEAAITGVTTVEELMEVLNNQKWTE